MGDQLAQVPLQPVGVLRHPWVPAPAERLGSATHGALRRPKSWWGVGCGSGSAVQVSRTMKTQLTADKKDDGDLSSLLSPWLLLRCSLLLHQMLLLFVFILPLAVVYYCMYYFVPSVRTVLRNKN